MEDSSSELRYSLFSVELKKTDILWLWDQLDNLFEGYEPERRISGTSGRGIARQTVEGADVRRFLESAFIGDVLASMTMSFNGTPSRKAGATIDLTAKAKVGSIEVPVRRLVKLEISENEETRLAIEGEDFWIKQVRGAIDPYLAKRKRRVRLLRYVSLISWIVFPAAAVYFIGVRLQLSEPLSPAMMFAVFALFPSIYYADRLYPLSLVVVDDRGINKPWYLEWAGRIWAAVVTAFIVSVLFSSL